MRTERIVFSFEILFSRFNFPCDIHSIYNQHKIFSLSKRDINEKTQGFRSNDIYKTLKGWMTKFFKLLYFSLLVACYYVDVFSIRDIVPYCLNTCCASNNIQIPSSLSLYNLCTYILLAIFSTFYILYLHRSNRVTWKDKITGVLI